MLRVASKAFFSVLLLGFVIPLANAERPSDGTLSNEEATVLWERATLDFQRADYESAAHALKRLTARIPTHERALQAQELLGECQLRLGRYSEAQAAFKIYLLNSRDLGPGSNAVSSRLAEAHLLAAEPTQALLIAEKLLKRSELRTESRWSYPLDSQIQKVRALLALKQDRRADSALEAAQKRDPSQSALPAQAKDWIVSLEFQLKARSCDALQFHVVSKKKPTRLNEAQVIDRVQRHAACVRDLKPLRPVLKEALPRSQATEAWNHSLAILEKSCDGPDAQSVQGPRSPQEKTFFFRELKRKLQESCEPTLTEVRS
ncbi:MAG: tetratricopeptide repeat protein [Oligoflexia bacterium]|jgi:tetratricopeptide (TPR) repeat protein